jgi:hypothetical protein
MQLAHLLLADLVWITFVLLAANALAAQPRNLTDMQGPMAQPPCPIANYPSPS